VAFFIFCRRETNGIVADRISWDSGWFSDYRFIYSSGGKNFTNTGCFGDLAADVCCVYFRCIAVADL
jgi:hypothetical protein